MSRRAAVALIASIAASLFITGATSSNGVGADPLTARLAAAQRVLDARVAALQAGDRAAWLATVDPAAPDAFKVAQGVSFDGLHSLPLATFELTARLDDTGDLAAGLDARYKTPAFLPETRQTLRLRDYDATDAIDSLWLTFVQRGDAWFVAADDDLSSLGLDSFKGLWDLGPVATIAGPHALVLYHPDQAARARALAAITEEAIGVLDQRWDHPWPEKIPVILPGSTTELDTMLQSVIDLDKFVAFTTASAVRDGDGYAMTAPRIFAQDHNLGRYNHAGQVEILVHELAHAAAEPVSGPFIPSWVHEGVADWEARGKSTTERKPKGSDGVLPSDFEFTTGAQATIVLQYDEARSAMSAAAARYGPAAPTAILATLGTVKVGPGSADYQLDQAIRNVTKAGTPDLQAVWAAR